MELMEHKPFSNLFILYRWCCIKSVKRTISFAIFASFEVSFHDLFKQVSLILKRDKIPFFSFLLQTETLCSILN